MTQLSKQLGGRTMRSRAAPTCYLCGALGRVLYQNLIDRTFNTPGAWTLKKCTVCGLLWLDPLPLEEDISIAYQTYYTHNDYVSPPSPPMTASGPARLGRRLLRRAMRTVLLPLMDTISIDKRARDAMYLRH